MKLFRYGVGLCLFLAVGAAFSAQAVRLENEATSGGLVLYDVYTQDFSGLFSASNGVTGQEPWVTDGTPEGTRLLLDINPGAAGSYPMGVTKDGDYWYFFAMDEGGKFDLWKSDLTAAGTVMVADINVKSVVRKFLPYSGGLFFFTGNDNYEFTPWYSDKTSSGTFRLSVPEGFSAVSGLVVVNDKIFIGGSLQGEVEPWVIDMNSKEVALLKDVNPTGGASTNYILTAELENQVLFFADDGVHGSELWKTDGTSTGTEMVKDLIPGPTGVRGWAMERVSSDTVYFCQSQLWKSDGTGAGTESLADVVVPPVELESPYRAYTPLGDIHVFAGQTTASGTELWRTDGTVSGTTMVKEIKPGSNGSNPNSFVRINNLVYFVASDYSHGNELWQTDGTAEGTTITYDFNPGPDNSDPANLIAINDELVLSARNMYSGIKVWSYKPANHSVKLISDSTVIGYNTVSNFAVKNGKVLFFGHSNLTGRNLWAYDPVVSGVVSWMDY